MNYENHLNRIIQNFSNAKSIINKYPNASAFEKAIIILRENNCNYAQIQNWLGSPSKREVRSVLLKYDSKLIEKDCNNHKLIAKDKPSILEYQAINWIKKNNITQFIHDDIIYNPKIKDGRLYFDDECLDKYGDYDIVCQTQILNGIKNAK